MKELQFLCGSFFIEKDQSQKSEGTSCDKCNRRNLLKMFSLPMLRRELTVSTASEGGTSF